jgi:hypothetical protein
MSSQTAAPAHNLGSRSALALGKAALLCASLFQAGCSGVVPKPEIESAHPSQQGDLTTPPMRISIAAVGDIMLGTDYPQDHLPEDVAVQLAQITPVLLGGGEVAMRCAKFSSGQLFRSPPSCIGILASADFNLLNRANNHARDFAEEWREAMMQALDEVGIHHSGRGDDIAAWRQSALPIRELSLVDFPDGVLIIDDEGYISVKPSPVASASLGASP